MKEKTKNIIFLIGFIYILLGLALYLGTSITGYAIFIQKEYSITSEDLIYNNSEIDISGNIIKLKGIIKEYQITKKETQKAYIQEAIKNKKREVTNEVIGLDNNFVNTKELKIKLDKNLKNNDTLRLYLKERPYNTKIYVCPYEQENCKENNYGHLTYENPIFSVKGNSTIKVKLIKNDAQLSSDIYLISNGEEKLLIKNSKNNKEKEKEIFFPEEKEFNLMIKVNGSPMNLRNYQHTSNSKFAKIEKWYDNWIIKFEDLPEEKADWDYNDVVLEIQIEQENPKEYNIPLTNIKQPTNKFKLISDKPVKYDYIEGEYVNITHYNYTRIEYPKKAEIQTKKITLNGTIYGIVKNQTLKNNTINYYYSFDSEDWNNLTNEILNSTESSIKIKANLIRKNNLTPEINNIKIIYLEPAEKQTNLTQDNQTQEESNQTEDKNSTPKNPSSTSGSSGGSSGGSSSSTTSTNDQIYRETQEINEKQEVYQLPTKGNNKKQIIIGDSELKKQNQNLPFLEILTAKIVFSGKNMVSFFRNNIIWWLLLLALVSSYIGLYIKRRKAKNNSKKKTKRFK